jgi:hypothetical protein
VEGTHEMHVNDRFEVLLRDLFEGPVADIAGIVNEDIDSPEMIER